jgi:hypothetical protein
VYVGRPEALNQIPVCAEHLSAVGPSASARPTQRRTAAV